MKTKKKIGKKGKGEDERGGKGFFSLGGRLAELFLQYLLMQRLFFVLVSCLTDTLSILCLACFVRTVSQSCWTCLVAAYLDAIQVVAVSDVQ